MVSDVEAAVCDAVPDGTTAIFTVTAPIRQGSKTTAAIIENIRALLRAGQTETKRTINGNSVRIRIVQDGVARSEKVIGFVHNPDPGAAQALLSLESEQRPR